MDITQSVDPRNNIFLELMNMSRNALFAGKNVCMPHAPSVGAGIPWVAHPICPTSHQRKYTLHLKFSTSTKFSFYQQRWLHSRIHLCTNVVVKNSWCINPIVWCHAGSRSSQKPVGFCTEIGQWYGFGPGQHQGHSCLAQDDDLTEQSGLGLHSCNTRGSLYHYRSWMLHRVNGSNRELEQNPTRHSWSFSKITPDDWR